MWRHNKHVYSIRMILRIWTKKKHMVFFFFSVPARKNQNKTTEEGFVGNELVWKEVEKGVLIIKLQIMIQTINYNFFGQNINQ